MIDKILDLQLVQELLMLRGLINRLGDDLRLRRHRERHPPFERVKKAYPLFGCQRRLASGVALTLEIWGSGA